MILDLQDCSKNNTPLTEDVEKVCGILGVKRLHVPAMSSPLEGLKENAPTKTWEAATAHQHCFNTFITDKSALGACQKLRHVGR